MSDDDEYYNKCVACFNGDTTLIKCNRCIYKICKHCIVNVAKTDIKLCREIGCKYEFLDDNENCHCYVCVKNDNFAFNCPTCALKRVYPVSLFKEELLLKTKERGVKRYKSYDNKLCDFYVCFFTVLDLDTGITTLLSFRDGPKTIFI